MGKRSNFKRNPRDFYATPYEAVLPLLGHLPRRAHFVEPCAGDGRLVRHLQKNGFKCDYACDLDPQAEGIEQKDVLFFNRGLPRGVLYITNPPWSRNILHPMIELFRSLGPTWLLFDSGWAFTEQAKPYLAYCQKIVTVGRISWMGNGISSLDDCAWYLFTDEENEGYSRFY